MLLFIYSNVTRDFFKQAVKPQRPLEDGQLSNAERYTLLQWSSMNAQFYVQVWLLIILLRMMGGIEARYHVLAAIFLVIVTLLLPSFAKALAKNAIRAAIDGNRSRSNGIVSWKRRIPIIQGILMAIVAGIMTYLIKG